MSFGPSLPELFRRAAQLVNKILKGAKPADLPVEQATKFELVINMKTGSRSRRRCCRGRTRLSSSDRCARNVRTRGQASSGSAFQGRFHHFSDSGTGGRLEEFLCGGAFLGWGVAGLGGGGGAGTSTGSFSRTSGGGADGAASCSR
jgi:hypothetical protein